MIVEYDHDDEQEELGMKVDTIVDDMITDQELGGILVAQAFVDYCQALINAEVIEEDGSIFFGILERSVSTCKCRCGITLNHNTSKLTFR